MGRYPTLSAELAKQLSAVPSTDRIYHPCVVTLHDGSVIDKVYVVDAKPWFRHWGVWPEADRGKHSVDIDTVAAIAESPSRLPGAFADKLYQAGESGMGYTIFTVRFGDGSSMAVVTGNAIDFIDYPAGQSFETVVDVIPHLGRNDPDLVNRPHYYWCLFESTSDRI